MPIRAPRQPLPSLNALRAFEAAARLESFALAAEELFVTPGAVAQQIRQLEDWLGAPLFRRLPQGVAATEAALRVLPGLSEAFDGLGSAMRALRADHRPREISIAALPCLAQLWLSPRLPALRTAFPGLQVSITAMEQPPRLVREPYDLALFYGAAAGPHDLAWPEDELLPVCAPGLIEPGEGPEALAGQTLLHDAVWRGDWARWLGFARSAGVDPRRGQVFSLYALAMQAALDGGGVLIGRRSLVAPHLADGRLVAPFRLLLPSGDRLVLGLTGAKMDGLARRVAEWLRSEG